jgi:hypothetical protein
MFIILKLELRFCKEKEQTVYVKDVACSKWNSIGEKQLTSIGPEDPKTRVTLPTNGPNE